MGRRQARAAHARGVTHRGKDKATQSNPRGLDARALPKRAGAPDFGALDSS